MIDWSLGGLGLLHFTIDIDWNWPVDHCLDLIRIRAHAVLPDDAHKK